MKYSSFQCYNNNTGGLLKSASVYVYEAGTTTLAALYSKTGTALISNPVVSDSGGFVGFRVADGEYDIRISAENYSETIYNFQIVDEIAAVADAKSYTDDIAKICGHMDGKLQKNDDLLPVSFFSTVIDGDPTSGPPTLTRIPYRGYDLRIPYLPDASADNDVDMVVRGFCGALETGRTFQVTWKQNPRVIAPNNQDFYPGLILLNSDKTNWAIIGQTQDGNYYRYGTIEYASAFSGTIGGHGIQSSSFGFTVGENVGAGHPNGLCGRWFRLIFDGTNIKILTSGDGNSWQSPPNGYYSFAYPGITSTVLLGGSPAYIGFGAMIYATTPSTENPADPDIDEIFGTVSSGYRVKIEYLKFEYLS